MDIKKKPSDEFNTTTMIYATAAVAPLPTVNVHLKGSNSNSRCKETHFWTPLCFLSVFGSLFLLFHLYVSTTYYHAAMDHGLHKLEEEVHNMVKMQMQLFLQNASTTDGAVIPTAAVVDANKNTPVPSWGDHRALADHIMPHERRHRGASRRAKLSRMEVQPPVKRGGSVLTWFTPGTGACGGHNGNNDFIIAISHIIWNGGAHCGDTVTISYHGKTAQATVVDECMGCDPGHIDLSPGLLHYLAGPGTDMVTDANWSFGAPPAPKPKTTPKPQATSTYSPKPQPTAPTTTSEADPKTSASLGVGSILSSKFYSSSSSTESSSSSASASAPSATPLYADDGQVHNLEDINVLLLDFAGILLSGLSSED